MCLSQNPYRGFNILYSVIAMPKKQLAPLPCPSPVPLGAEIHLLILCTTTTQLKTLIGQSSVGLIFPRTDAREPNLSQWTQKFSDSPWSLGKCKSRPLQIFPFTSDLFLVPFLPYPQLLLQPLPEALHHHHAGVRSKADAATTRTVVWTPSRTAGQLTKGGGV